MAFLVHRGLRGTDPMASATLDYNGSLVTNAVTTQRAKFDWCAGVSKGTTCVQ